MNQVNFMLELDVTCVSRDCPADDDYQLHSLQNGTYVSRFPEGLDIECRERLCAPNDDFQIYDYRIS